NASAAGMNITSGGMGTSIAGRPSGIGKRSTARMPSAGLTFSARLRAAPFFKDESSSPRIERPTGTKPAGRPVDWLGLTKRWSLYVASTATPGFLTDLRQAELKS